MVGEWNDTTVSGARGNRKQSLVSILSHTDSPPCSTSVTHCNTSHVSAPSYEGPPLQKHIAAGTGINNLLYPSSGQSDDVPGLCNQPRDNTVSGNCLRPSSRGLGRYSYSASCLCKALETLENRIQLENTAAQTHPGWGAGRMGETPTIGN